MLKDVRYAIRMLIRSPLFTVVGAASLAIGIGGAASVFTVLNAVVLRSLPIPNPQQLYLAEKHRAHEVNPRYSWPLFEQARQELKGRAELFAATAATGMQVRIAGRTDAAAAERGLIQLVSGEFFDVLRQQAHIGRLIAPTDNTSVGAHPVAVISDACWERRFQRSPDIVGRELVIGGATLKVIGVTSPEFFGPLLTLRNPDVWVPLMMQPEVRYAFNASSYGGDTRKPWPPQSEIEWLHVFARVPSSADVPAVNAALTVLHHRDGMKRLDATNDEGRKRLSAERVVLDPAHRGVSSLRADLSSSLFLLLGVGGVLLAITCGNLASLLIARARARERELTIRSAIGAGRWRVVRQLLVETLVLSAIGGVLGLLVAAWGRDALLAMFSSGAATIDLDPTFDLRVLGFGIGITLLSGLAAGVMPALRATRVAPADALKAQSHQTVAARGRRSAIVGKTLVTAQIAFCLLMLVVAGLFMRSMRSLLQTDVGYQRHQLLVARIDVRSMGLSNERRQAMYDRVLTRLQQIPGVADASISLNGPLSGSERKGSFGVEGYTPAPGEQLSTNEDIITPSYFETVGLRIVEGRGFTIEDRQPDSRSTIVNETMAKRFFPNGGAIGKRWSYGGTVAPDSYVIVGIVQDAKYLGVRGTLPNMIYHLSATRPDDVLSNLELRSSVTPSQLVTTVKQALAETEPALPVYDIIPLDERLNRFLSNDRLVANLTTTFGSVALILACLGLYGTISYGVTRRVTEIGVRMALGASRRDVSWLVVREALLLVLAGAALGIPLAYLAGRSIASMLYGIGPVDSMSYLTGTALLLAVASLAAYLPAHRASRIDPMIALRAE